MNKTLAYYNKFAADYISSTIGADVSELYDFFIKYMQENAHILDLGCGSGRDSKFFIDKGYSVVAVDGSTECCKLASGFINQDVICKEFEDIDFDEEFDGVWACASLLHVPSERLMFVFGKIARSLKSGGYLFACFKYGDFEGERNGRYFTYLTEERLINIIMLLPELKIVEKTVSDDVRADRINERWLNVIIKKD